MLIFLAYFRFSLHLYTYERASYGHIRSITRQGIRKLKIKLKNSCTFRSDFGADAFLELHSIVETAKKHDKTPYNTIQALFKV